MWLPRGVAVLAAALGGLGVVMWIAANWASMGRVGHFALLQGLVLVMGVGAALKPAARGPLGLLALLGIGALFAYFGQTYQTGADPWQLFALWAVLALPLCWGARSDVLWAPWALVVVTAISLWTHTYSGHRWGVEPDQLQRALDRLVCGPGAGGGAQPRASSRVTGAGVWSFRTAVTLTVAAITLTALGGLFHKPVQAQYVLGLLVFAVGLALLNVRALFDIFAISAVALGVNALLAIGVARWLFDNGGGGDWVGKLMLMGLIAAGLLAGTVSGILQLGAPPCCSHNSHRRNSMSTTASRPWPVVLLTALGAWFAAIPVLIAVGMLLGDTLLHGVGAYVVGVLVLGAAVVVLRAHNLPLFVEQLAIPALLVGGGTLTMGVMSDFDQVGGSLLLLAVVLALAAAIPQAWLRVLLGALAAGLLGVALVPESGWGSSMARMLWVLHGLLAVWLLVTYAPRPGAALQALIEPMASGWLLATVAALAWMSGTSFLVAGAVGANELGGLVNELNDHAERSLFGSGLQVLSAALVLAAAALGARAWPALRSVLALAVAAVLAVLAWFMPALGATLLALMVVALAHQLALGCGLRAGRRLDRGRFLLPTAVAAD